jgi:hypothetical protein
MTKSGMNTTPVSIQSSEHRSLGLASNSQTQPNVTRIFHGIYNSAEGLNDIHCCRFVQQESMQIKLLTVR